jgi:hypothetical protein
MPLDLISCLVLAGVIGPMLALDVLHRDALPVPSATPPADAPSL